MVPALEVKDLKTYFTTIKGTVKAADGISFAIEQGKAMGLVGESGCGKTTIGLSILRILPTNGRIVDGHILFDGVDLVPKSEEEMNKIRWCGISMIFQAAMNALNPVYRVGDQIVEAIRAHEKIAEEEAQSRIKPLFKLVGMDPATARQYPHELSGGMKQRSIIAMALSCNPKVIIADEPTTALDVMVQDRILKEIRALQQKLNMTMLYISHDISVIAETCDDIAVMYAGNLVEYADKMSLFERPLHPYTKALMGAFPSIVGEKRALGCVPGEPPTLLNPPQGCRFRPRCPNATDRCKYAMPPLTQVEKRHWVACFQVW